MVCDNSPAFEWKCRRFGVSLSKQSQKDKDVTLLEIDNLIDRVTGARKKHFKSYRRMLENIDLAFADKIKRIFRRFDTYLVPLKEQAYQSYPTADDSRVIANRLQNQRNDFAHGNLDKEIKRMTVIDVGLLRRLLYIMQLDGCDIDPKP